MAPAGAGAGASSLLVFFRMHETTPTTKQRTATKPPAMAAMVPALLFLLVLPSGSAPSESFAFGVLAASSSADPSASALLLASAAVLSLSSTASLPSLPIASSVVPVGGVFFWAGVVEVVAVVFVVMVVLVLVLVVAVAVIVVVEVVVVTEVLVVDVVVVVTVVLVAEVLVTVVVFVVAGTANSTEFPLLTPPTPPMIATCIVLKTKHRKTYSLLLCPPRYNDCTTTNMRQKSHGMIFSCRTHIRLGYPYVCRYVVHVHRINFCTSIVTTISPSNH